MKQKMTEEQTRIYDISEYQGQEKSERSNF